MLRLHKLWFNMLVFGTIKNEYEKYEFRLAAQCQAQDRRISLYRILHAAKLN